MSFTFEPDQSGKPILQKDFAKITRETEIASIRTAALHYEATAFLHAREVTRLNNLARQANEQADKLEGKQV